MSGSFYIRQNGHSESRHACGKNNDAREHLHATSTPPTHFNTPLAPRSGALGMHQGRVERGHPWVKKRSKMFFAKVVPMPLGKLMQVLLTCLEPVVTCFGRKNGFKRLENGPFQHSNRVQRGSPVADCHAQRLPSVHEAQKSVG